MEEREIARIIEEQRAYFATGATVPVEARLRALAKLRRVIEEREGDIAKALYLDLGKSAVEGYMCETGMTLAELRYQMKHVRRWARPRRVRTGLANFPAKSFTVAEPYGVALAMSPWNYPFMLAMEPLVGAVAAGNCCVVKPSAYAPATSAVIRGIVEEAFDPGHVTVVEGGRQENAALLEQRFDYIFFTGGKAVGRLVMEKAAAHLTPVTLELGGKSPCVVTADADLKTAAARVAFGKYLNCGQTCVAPDYLLVDERVHDEFLELLFGQIARMYGRSALDNPDYGRIVNRKHFDRLCGLMASGTTVYGGQVRDDELRIEPTVLDGVTLADAVMQEEIFGPVLPVIAYRTLDEACAAIASLPKPLALYLFTSSRETERRFLARVPFGGGCINDTIVHLATSEMGFGGVGESGMGSYHGRKSFETFSHEKSILKKRTWLDLPLRYQPYADWKEKGIRLFLR